MKHLENIPQSIGSYHIIDYLGEGGIGTVYLAEQREPVRRKVAVKILRDPESNPESGWRFHKERGTLARMNHHFIAQVFDAGNLADGRPYMVLELVPGLPITQFCNEHRLSHRERIECFIKVCQGIQHAHQKGIIHRDLKPNNIFVSSQDGKPLPKIIDFGVAKAIESQSLSLSNSAETREGGRPGTPFYMSPEQITGIGGDLDTRTDIYALGVILFQLLTGRLPFDENTTLLSYMQATTSQTPPRPSEKASNLGEKLAATAHARATRPRSLIYSLRGDLDWIILKAMAPSREDRYESANELAMDLMRYLASEPLPGYTGSTPQRLLKFVNRHRLSVGILAVFLLLLLAGMVGIGWKWRKVHRMTQGMIETRAATVRETKAVGEATDFLLEMLAPENHDSDGARVRTPREALDRSTHLVTKELAQEPAAAGRIFLALGEAYLWLGLPAEALPLLQKAVLQDPGQQRKARLALARAQIGLNELDRAEVLLATKSSPPHPAEALLQARIAGKRGQYQAAEALLDASLASLLGSDPEHPFAPAYLVELARACAALGHGERAEVLLRDSLTRSQNRWGAGHPQTLVARFELGTLLLKVEKPSQAEPFLLNSLYGYTRFYGREHAYTREVVEALVSCYRNLGEQRIAKQYEMRLE